MCPSVKTLHEESNALCTCAFAAINRFVVYLLYWILKDRLRPHLHAHPHHAERWNTAQTEACKTYPRNNWVILCCLRLFFAVLKTLIIIRQLENLGSINLVSLNELYYVRCCNRAFEILPLVFKADLLEVRKSWLENLDTLFVLLGRLKLDEVFFSILLVEWVLIALPILMRIEAFVNKIFLVLLIIDYLFFYL